MTTFQKLRAQSVIRRVARRQGITCSRCYSDMAASIEDAWATADSQAKQRQIEPVGEDRTPTPEEFIVLVSTNL